MRKAIAIPLFVALLQPQYAKTETLADKIKAWFNQSSDITSRIINGTQANIINPEINYNLAIAAIQNYDYDAAMNHFIKVIEYGQISNPYYEKTINWISPNKKYDRKLYKHMAKFKPQAIEGNILIAEYYLNKAKASAIDPEYEGNLAVAEAYATKAKNEKSDLEQTIQKQKQ